MGFEAGYLLVALREGRGYLPYHFSGRSLARKFKKVKKFGEYVFFGEGPFYLVLVRSDHEGGR